MIDKSLTEIKPTMAELTIDAFQKSIGNSWTQMSNRLYLLENLTQQLLVEIETLKKAKE